MTITITRKELPVENISMTSVKGKTRLTARMSKPNERDFVLQIKDNRNPSDALRELAAMNMTVAQGKEFLGSVLASVDELQEWTDGCVTYNAPVKSIQQFSMKGRYQVVIRMTEPNATLCVLEIVDTDGRKDTVKFFTTISELQQFAASTLTNLLK